MTYFRASVILTYILVNSHFGSKFIFHNIKTEKKIHSYCHVMMALKPQIRTVQSAQNSKDKSKYMQISIGYDHQLQINDWT